MKMGIGEKKILVIFGCANCETTINHLYRAVGLIPEPDVRKVIVALADKLDSKEVDKWHHCFFHNIKLEIEVYYRHRKSFKYIMGGSKEADNDGIEKETITLFNEDKSTTSIYTYNANLKRGDSV